MYSNSKFVDQRPTNNGKISAANGASSNAMRSSEMTKIKIVNHNANLANSNANRNNHKNSKNNEQHLIFSTSHYSSKHSNINLSSKNSLLHRQQSDVAKYRTKKLPNEKQLNTAEMSNQSEQTDSIRSIDSISELANIDQNKEILSSSFEYFENDDDSFSQDFSLEKSSNDDLVHLNNLNEATVLENLKKRFSKNQIYTYIGDILIAMNPLKAISIYGKKVSNYYKKCEKIRAKLPPHIYATAEHCFREMIRTQQSQCILISGESGSGKTETCKYLVQHLLNRTKPFESCLNAKIHEVNPLLEAFGNAKTRINDNSSRFGKYLEIYFEQDGTVVGAKFKEYLLEKSRVVYQNEYESTFHIFYLLFAGLSAEEKLRYGLLRSPKKFRFLSNTNVDSCMSSENEENFFAIKKSLNTIGFVKEDIENLIKVLINVLFIGEIQFCQKKGNNNDAVQVKNKEIIKNICDLLEMDPSELNEALVSDVQITRGEEIKRERNMVQASDVRDALAKAFYGRLFSWIVNQINHHIQPAEGIGLSYSIGLLDIFGFENFERNSFEQMCINLANEQLHQLFTKYIFKLEIQECLDEQIELSNSDLVNYQDNQIILDLFLEKRAGIFPLLDEESRFPKATDQSLAIKLHQTLSPAYPDVYIAPKNVGTSFHIVHYAGQVLYSCEGFLEKNRDFLPNNLFYAAKNSNNSLVQELFQCKLTRKGTLAPSDRQCRLRKSDASIKDTGSNSSKSSDNHNEIYLTRLKFNGVNSSSSSSSNVYLNRDELKNSVGSHQNNYSSDKALPLTVASHFKNSLHELIDKINKCKAYFIRCIKPNPNQENVFLNEFVIKQLRYCSLMHVCKIRKCGYPYRIKFDEFLKWYKAIEVCICRKSESITDQNNNLDENLHKCLKCLEYAKITNYKVGKTKLFLRYWHIDIFNSLAKKLEKNVVTAQKIVRGWLVRTNFKKIQQNEAKKFFHQIENRSDNFCHKLDKHNNFLINPSKLNKSSDEEFSNESNKSLSPINRKPKMSPTKQKEIIDTKKNWPDLNEIEHALEEFDSMLEAYETNVEIKENKSRIYVYQPNLGIKNSHLSRSSSSFGNQPPKLSPTSVYHLVHNNNNKNDNTLKKKNALVAFEFKTLLDKVAPFSNGQQIQYPGCLVIEEDKSLHDDISNSLPSPPFIYQDENYMASQNHSPPSYSYASSSSSASNSSDSSDHERTVSPSQLNRTSRYVSPPPPNERTAYSKQNFQNNLLLTELEKTDSEVRRNFQQVHHMRQKTQIIPITKPNDMNPHLILSEREVQSKVSINPGYFVNENNNYMNKYKYNAPNYQQHQSNVTIWREELNAKQNVQEQIKKQTELCQKLEDSKKNIPEWKKNLIRQKEMKRITSNMNGSNTNLNHIPETPELMKHNIFIKKGLAAQK